MNPTGSCEECPCFLYIPDKGTYGYTRNENDPNGECHRCAPGMGGMTTCESKWPKVHKSDWCHEGRILMEEPTFGELCARCGENLPAEGFFWCDKCRESVVKK